MKCVRFGETAPAPAVRSRSSARLALLAALLPAVGAFGEHDAVAQAYPTRPIRLIVPFAPGGGTDIIARLMAQKLSADFGQQVVVDNRPGAGGTLGAEMAVRAAPDGYTFAMVSGSYSVNPSIYKLPYDPVTSIQTVSEIGRGPFVACVNASVPARTIKELIALAKAKPGSLNYASSGTGGITQLATELFMIMTQTSLMHIPYKGTGPALTDLVGGQVQVLFGAVPAVIPQMSGNKIRALAVTTAKRAVVLPDIPTIAETVPGYESASWYLLFAPRNVARDIVQRWAVASVNVVNTREMQDRLTGEGLEAIGSSPQEAARMLRAEIDKWAKVVKAAGIKAGD